MIFSVQVLAGGGLLVAGNQNADVVGQLYLHV